MVNNTYFTSLTIYLATRLFKDTSEVSEGAGRLLVYLIALHHSINVMNMPTGHLPVFLVLPYF